MPRQVKLGKGQEFIYHAPRRGATGKYPWELWLTDKWQYLDRDTVDQAGNVLQKGDFSIDVNIMVPKIKAAARRRYLVAEVSRTDADGVTKLENCICVRARQMNEQERVEEDAKRVKERAALALKAKHSDSGNEDDDDDDYEEAVA